MVLTTEKTSALVFAPSPPLSASASAGASDCEQETGENRLLERKSAQQPQLRTHDKRTDSSPCSLDSSPSTYPASRSVPSAISSFTSDHKQEEEVRGDKESETGSRPQEDLPRRRAGHLKKAFSLIKASWRGRFPDTLSEWCVLRISSSEFQTLRQWLGDYNQRLLDYFEELRYDYNPDTGTLVLRLMASALHEIVQEELIYYIRVQLENVAKDPLLSDLVSDIESHGHAKVRLGAERRAKKSPDGQLWFRSTPSRLVGKRPYHFDGYDHPQFIMEVGYSQGAASLQRLAMEYYQDSSGQIKTVLTFKVDYADPGERARGRATLAVPNRGASFCLYRGPERVDHNVAFRDADGNAIAGSLLHFILTDFVPDEVLEQLSPAVKRQAEATVIDIPATLLCQFLQRAEDAQDECDRKSDSSVVLDHTSQSSRKRKTVHWSLEPDDQHDDGFQDVSSSDSSEEIDSTHAGRQSRGSASSSKRRKTRGRSDDKEWTLSTSRRGTNCDAHQPQTTEKRRTRSMSRNEETRRTRSMSREQSNAETGCRAPSPSNRLPERLASDSLSTAEDLR